MMRATSFISLLISVVEGLAVYQEPANNYRPPTLGLPVLSNATRQALRDISLMFPTSNGKCPENAYREIDQSMVVCDTLIKRAEQRDECIMYVFGVGSDDPILRMAGSEYRMCSVFAFDPTITHEDFKNDKYESNVKFFNWGLHSLHDDASWNHVVYGQVSGQLYTLSEIQHKLGHTGRRISLMRLDCEGCEWAVVAGITNELVSSFDQVIIEVHFAQSLRFGRKEADTAVAMSRFLEHTFVPIAKFSNWGYSEDQCNIHQELIDAGVDERACCRTISLVNKHFAIPADASHAFPLMQESAEKYGFDQSNNLMFKDVGKEDSYRHEMHETCVAIRAGRQYSGHME